MKNVMRMAGATLLLLALLVQMVAPAEAADSVPGVIVLAGRQGNVTAWTAEHRAELAIDGYAPVTFQNARILVTRARITVTARTPEHTLFAWVNRSTGLGAIGVIARPPQNRRHPQTFSVLVDRVTLDGTTQITRR